jgi:hypothetical protein
MPTNKNFSRREFLKNTALSLPLAAAGCANVGTRSPKAGDFVVVRDGRFERRGRPYRYIGANMWYGCYLADAALPGGRARLVRELDRLRGIGCDNLRRSPVRDLPLVWRFPAAPPARRAMGAGPPARTDSVSRRWRSATCARSCFPELLATVRLRAIRPLDHRRNDSRSRQAGLVRGDWGGAFMKFSALLHSSAANEVVSQSTKLVQR